MRYDIFAFLSINKLDDEIPTHFKNLFNPFELWPFLCLLTDRQ